MREIKFRAWSPQSNKMIEVSELFIHPNITSLRGRDNDGSSLYTYTATGNEGYDSFLMQYTGLKDKNGVKIFEGDIVKGISYPAVCEVVFNDGSFWLIAKDWENTLGGMSADCEVIGNIWENGDLLKGEPNE